jgi:PQQ-dependent dehydrogenase (s-GDH family)
LNPTFDLSTLIAGATYSLTVKAKDLAGNESAASTALVVTTPDVEAPSIPGSLIATNVTYNSIAISWLPSTDNVGVTGYDVYRNGVKMNASNVAGTSYTFTGLSELTTYSITVKAKDAAGNESDFSNNLDVTTLQAPDLQAPSVPNGLSASNITQNSLSLDWSPSTDNVGVEGYDVYQNGVKINTVLVNSTSFNVTGLQAAVAYTFVVLAKDLAGNTSAPSSSVIITTPDTDAPSAPGNPSAFSVTNSSATVSWSAATDNVGVTGYDVYVDGVKSNISLVTNTSFNLTGLAELTAYNITVKAKDAAGNESVFSGTLNFTTLHAPDTQAPTSPTALVASGLTQSSVTITWTASTDNIGVAGYDVYRNGVKINGAIVSTTSFNVSGLSAATTYSFTVKAKDAAGNESTASSALNVTTPDTQAPSTPTGLVSSALTQSSVTISWTASTDNVGVTGYDVYQNGVKVNGSTITTTSFNVTGLSAATSYAFTVKAKDAAGNESTASSALNVTTPDTQAPTAPTGLASSALTQSSVTISWTASTDNIGVTGYDVYRNGVKVNGSTITTTSFNVTGLSAATSYAFTVKAKDAAGNESAASSALNVTTPDTQAPTTPTGLASSALTQSSVTISWTASTDNVAVAGYDVYRNGVKVNGSTITTTSFNVTGLSASTAYAFTVKAKDAAGNESAASSALNVTTPDTQAPTAPTGLASASLTQTSFTLSWTASTDNVGVTGYDVYRNGTKINGSLVTTTSYSVTGLTVATTYAFTVKAKDAAGNESAASTALNVTTPDTQAPTAPTGLVSSNITQSGFTVTWTAATDNVAVTGYDVYLDGVKVNASLVTVLNYTVSGLSASTTYAFSVRARDAAGNTSASSTSLNVTTSNAGAIENFTMRTVIANQRMPWDITWGPDNNIWYTERTGGRVSFVNPTTGVKRVVLTLGTNMVQSAGQDGLMGMAIHPEFNSGKPYVYIGYTYQTVSTTVRKTRIARYTYNFTTQVLESPVTILQDIPGSNDHNSGRMTIGPDLKLYYTVGDMGAGQFDNASRTNNAQNLNVYEGKVLRLNLELINSSWIPADNPFTGTSGKTAVYSYGHRNAQGLVWANVNGTNRLYSSEHGPYSDDEINLIESAGNYGWPQVSGLCDGNYNGRTIGGFAVVNEQTNCTNLNAKVPLRSIYPVATPPTDATNNMTWPSSAPSGIDFYSSNAIPGWQNSLLVANLKTGTITRFKILIRLTISEEKVDLEMLL